MKRQHKRLSLRTETLRTLSSTDIGPVRGGAIDTTENPTNEVCNTRDFTCFACGSGICGGSLQQTVCVGPCVTGLCRPF